MDLNNFFQEAVSSVKTLSVTPTEEELLVLYKYYKQATVGKCNIARPTSAFDFKGKIKWDAWNSVKSLSKEDAMLKYCDFVLTLKKKYS